MIKIYRVKSDVDRFRWLIPEVPDSVILDYTTFECVPRSADWSPPSVRVHDLLLNEGDFAYYTPGALVANPEAFQKVKPFFETAGEILPLRCNGNQYRLLNVTVCKDAMDHNKTEWYEDNGERVSITRFVFDEVKLESLKASIFKIPETCRGSVLTMEKNGNPEIEFKAFVETNGLSGLQFEELWTSAA